MSKRIHLGLDLRGGVHLILQVMVEEAVSADTDNTVGRVEQDLKAANLSFSQVYKPDPAKPEIIRVEGVAPGKGSDVRYLLESKYSNEYDVTGGGADNSFTLTMKPNVVTTLEEKTVQQAIETIRDRVDTLGVSEPVIEEYGLGDNQILVELPGIDDLDRVKSIIQSTAAAGDSRRGRRSLQGRAGGAGQRGRGASAPMRCWCMAPGLWLPAPMPTASTCCSASRWWPARTSAPPIRASIRTPGSGWSASR